MAMPKSYWSICKGKHSTSSKVDPLEVDNRVDTTEFFNHLTFEVAQSDLHSVSGTTCHIT